MATTVSLKPNAVEISGSTSGTTTLQATAVAGTTTLTLPAATDTLVGKATTDTLTNKTLTSPVLTTPALGTPASGVMTNVTGLPLTTGVTGTLPVANGGTGVTTSTGTGAVVLGTSPTLTTPTISSLSSASATALTLQSAGTTAVTIDTSQNLKFNSGYGSVATAYGCRAWVQFNGTGTISITGSGNVSSLTDYGTGDYGIAFTTNMPDTTYCAVGASIKAGGAPSAVNSGVISMSENIYTTGCGIAVISASSGAIDRAAVFVAVFR